MYVHLYNLQKYMNNLHNLNNLHKYYFSVLWYAAN